jgi:hypothetical protein
VVGRPGNGAGGVLDFEVEVELEVELEVVVEELEDDLVVVVVVVVVEPVPVGAQDSVSAMTTPVIGRFRLEIGVPGGTFTLNV